VVGDRVVGAKVVVAGIEGADGAVVDVEGASVLGANVLEDGVVGARVIGACVEVAGVAVVDVEVASVLGVGVLGVTIFSSGLLEQALR
jgi:hypothetical protein